MSKLEEIQRLVEDACRNDMIIEAITKYIKRLYLLKVLASPKDADDAVKELYNSWDTLEAITVLSARIDMENLSDYVLGLADSYLTTLGGEHLGKDVNDLVNIKNIKDRKELLALIALYFYGIVNEEGK